MCLSSIQPTLRVWWRSLLSHRRAHVLWFGMLTPPRSLAPGLTPPSHSIEAQVPTAQPGRPTGSARERRQRLSEWFLWSELHVTLLCPFYKRSPQRAGIPAITAIVILTVIVTHVGTEQAGFICTFPTYICYFSTTSSYSPGNVGAPSCCMSSTMSPTCQARRTGLITAEIHPIRSRTPLLPDPELRPFSHLYSHLQTKHCVLFGRISFHLVTAQVMKGNTKN